MDPAVKITKVASSVGFDPHSLLPTKNKIITFDVGAHGPFHITVGADQFTPEAVNALIDADVATLRGLGLLGS